MVKKSIIKEIDKVIKRTWKKKISEDYYEGYLLREDTLKCDFYFHLRSELDAILYENDLRIYTEYYFPDLGYRADMVIAQIDTEKEYKWLKDSVSEVVALFEFKFTAASDDGTADNVKRDVKKLKDYYQVGGLDNCQFYFTTIYEAKCSRLSWMDGRSINNWADGRVTELVAGEIDDEILFEVHSYNGMNKSLNDKCAVGIK